MLYRLDDAATASQIADVRDAVTAALPDGAVTSARSWLVVKKEANSQTSLFVPFLLTFGGLSLLLSVLIVGTVVAGAVGSTTRRIGILKALGFTPSQVVRAYVAQALLPASAGAVLGVVAGNLVAVPLLADTEDLYGTVALTIAPWVDVAVLVGALAVVTVTAAAAAGRAGRLSAVDALAVGRTPAAGRGRYAARVAARLPLSRPVTLGLARPFSAPARAAAMVLAIAFGAAAVTLAAGLATSLNRIQVAADHSAADLVVDGFGGGGPGGTQHVPKPGTEPETEREPADPVAVAAALDAEAGTAHWLGYAETDVVVPGLTGGTSSLVEYTEDPGWVGYELVSGRWFTRPGEAVVPTELLRSTDREIGDSLTLTRDGTPVTLTIVGEVFDPGNNDGLVLTQAGAGTTLTAWLVSVADGTDPGEYADALQHGAGPARPHRPPGGDGRCRRAGRHHRRPRRPADPDAGHRRGAGRPQRGRARRPRPRSRHRDPQGAGHDAAADADRGALVGRAHRARRRRDRRTRGSGAARHPAAGDGRRRRGRAAPGRAQRVRTLGARGLRPRRAGACHGRRAAASGVGGADPHGHSPADGVGNAAARVGPMGAAIEVVDLAKAYGEPRAVIRAVDGVTFDVGEGEFFGILGPNGAGKTTILEMIEGLRRPDAGSITLLGESPWPRNPGLLPRIGVQLQSTAFFERLTAREQIRTMASLYAVGPGVADEWLERVGLVDKADTRVGDLSGGQAQRLSIACALVHDPEVVFLDEPTAALDPQARRNLWELLAGLNDSGRTVVLTTHYMDEAEVLCDRVAIIDHGRILELDSPASLVRGLDAPTRITVGRRVSSRRRRRPPSPVWMPSTRTPPGSCCALASPPPCSPRSPSSSTWPASRCGPAPSRTSS